MKRAALILILFTIACGTATNPPSIEGPTTTPTVEAPPPPDPEAFRATAPPPGAPRPYQFPAVTRFTLPNGMRVLIAENHTAPLMTIHALVRSGVEHDPATHSGLAAFTADMLDEGAGRRSAIQIAEEVSVLGADLSSYADWDASNVTLDLLARNGERGLALVADLLRRPNFPAKEIRRVQRERLATLLQQRDQAGVIAANRFAQFVYGDTAYGRTILGTEAALKNITAKDVRQFHSRHYVPNNVSLIVTGDVDPAQIRALVERNFLKWEKGADVKPVTVTPAMLERSRIFIVDRPEAVQSEIRVGHVGVPRSTVDYFPLLTMNSVLGGVFGSRININLREKHGYTYGARSGWAFRQQAGPFIVSAPVRNEVTGAAVKEIFNELRRIRSGDLTEPELNDAKNFLTGVFPNMVQTAENLAARLAEMELYGLPDDYFNTYRERIAAITRDDVLRVANKYIDPDRAAVVIVGKASEVEPQLTDLQMPMGTYDIEGAEKKIKN